MKGLHTMRRLLVAASAVALMSAANASPAKAESGFDVLFYSITAIPLASMILHDTANARGELLPLSHSYGALCTNYHLIIAASHDNMVVPALWPWLAHLHSHLRVKRRESMHW